MNAGALEDALRAAETYREDLESTRADLARVTAERDAAVDALHQWSAAQGTGDLDELRNARAARDEVLRKAGRELVVEFHGMHWRIAPAVVPHTCEGCDAQKVPGVPCRVLNAKVPPCRDGILKRADVQP